MTQVGFAHIHENATHADPPQPATQRPDVALSGLLALIAGFVDAACFTGILEVFTAHVTGNIAALASTVARSNGTGALRVSALVAFGVGAASAWFARVAGPPAEAHVDFGRHRRLLQRLLAIEALWLVALVIAATWLGPHVDAATPRACIVIALAGAAMGCQSAMSKLPAGLDHPSTVMTSNYTEWVLLVLDASLALVRRCDDREPVIATFCRLGKLTMLLLCFALGALAGALGEARAGMEVMLLPLALLLFALVRSVRAPDAPSSRPSSR